MKKKKFKKHGFTLIEAMMGMTITGIVLVGVISSQMGNYKAVEKNKDAIFAQNKAVQMIEELRSVVKKGESAVNTLDTYDNKGTASPILTTDDIEGITPDAKAANQISGNRIQNGKWRFVRDVKITKSPDSPKSRKVTVSVYYADANGNPIQPPLATLSTILSSAYGSNLPTQVMDTYALAISNQPGWWSSLSSLKQTIQDSAYDLKVKNPGLDYRFHFITRSSFGRDPYYTPYCNKVSTTDTDGKIAFPYVYYGRITDTSRGGIKGYFYNPVDMINDGMRLQTDEEVNGADIYNTWYGARETPSNTPVGSSATTGKATTQVYSAADQYNHAVRGPEDIAINDKLKTYYANQKPAMDYEPSYRKFIDDMYESDKEIPIHRNLMITNLHGELFPTIPLRNYSDAAKSPSGKELLHDISSTGIVEKNIPISNMYKRVVTHPEQLEYSTDPNRDRKIYLRVYPYLSDPTQTTANVNKIDTISLFIPTTKYVGANTTGTEKQVLDNLPDFTIPNTTAVIDQIKNNIKFQYIDDDFVKRSNNYSAYVKITAPKQGGWAANFDPIGSTFDIKTGTGSTSKTYKFKVVARRDASHSDEYKHWLSVSQNSNVLNSTPNTDIDNVYKIVSCDLDKTESLTVPTDLKTYFDNNQILSARGFTNGNAGVINPPSSGSSNTTTTGWTVQINRFDDINNSYSDLGLDPTKPELNPKIHTVYDGTYEIIVNPAFDRMGTGRKTINPGILIKLHGTGTKHTQKDDPTGAPVTDKGIPITSRLYGLDYIPSPLGKNMFRRGTSTKSYPIKNVNGSSYYTDTFTDTISGGSNNSDLLFGSGYGAYTGLYGRDLSDTGNYAKNTARWIISINVGNGNSNNSTNILSKFQDKMMAVETRIGENLNTGMSINQSPNPYDGTVKQTALVPNPSAPGLTDYIVINPTDTAKNNGAYNCDNNVGDCGSVTEGFPSFLASSGATKPTLSNSNKNELSNLSRTYVWIGNSAKNGIKESERYQMIGDIRHNPYIDTLEYNRVNLHFNTIVSGSVNDVGSAASLRNSTSDASSGDYPNLGVFDDNTILSQNKTILDVSSFFHLFKTSLLASNSIYNSLIGYSFYYYGLGGEVGSNGNALNNTDPIKPKGSVNFYIKGIPYNQKNSGQIGESSGDSYNEILESHNLPKNVGARIIGNNDQSWGSIPWIGELYPDSDFGENDVSTTTAKWANTGNLHSELSDLPSSYSRQLYTTGFKNITPTWAKLSGGSYWAYSVDKIEPRNRLNAVGSQMFFHGSADADTTKSFNQTVLADDAMVQGNLTSTTGTDLVSNYGLIMPSIIDVARPFSLVGSSASTPKIPSNTPLWNMYNSKYSKLYFLGDGVAPNPTTTTPDSEAVFYDAGITGDYSSMAGSAPVMIDGSSWKPDPYGTGRNKGYVLVNGLASQGIESGTIIGRYALMSMLHTYFRTGDKKNSPTNTSVFKNRSIMIERTVIQDSTNSNNAKLTPRDGVEIKPTKPLDIIWKTSWKKWDGTNYSKDYANDWAEQKVKVKYNVLVSTDNRGTWKYLNKNDGTLSTEKATAGVHNPNPDYVFEPSVTGDTDNELGVATELKLDTLDGNIVFRIEGHRFDTSTTNSEFLIPTNYSYHERTISINRN